MNGINIKTIRSQAPLWTCLTVLSVGLSLVVTTSAADTTTRANRDESVKAETTELSVAPLDHVVYPPDRPQWLDQSPSLGGDVDSVVVVSEPALSAKAAADELRWMQRAAIATYVSQLAGWPGPSDVDTPDDETIDRDLVARRYDGVVTVGDETRYESATELRFDAEQRARFAEAWTNATVARRLKTIGGLASLGLVTLFCTGGLIGVISRRHDAAKRS